MAFRSAGNNCIRGLALAAVLAVAAPFGIAPPVALAQNATDSGSDGATLPPPDAVQSGQLAPIAPIQSGDLPPPGGAAVAPQADVPQAVANGGDTSFWQGSPGAEVQAQMAKIELPLRSPVMASLWRRALLADGPPAGSDPAQFLTARLDGLYRAGLLKDAAALLARSPKSTDPQQLAAGAHVLLGLGDDTKACAAVKALPLSGGPLKGRVRNDALLMVAYCAARDKQPNHASLAAEVLRDQSFADPLALAVLDSIAESKTPKVPHADNITLIDYKFLSLLGNVQAERYLARAAPELIVGIANDTTADPAARLAAAEAAARINAIDDADLAALYKATAFQPQQLADPQTGLSALPIAMQHALLLQAMEHEQSPARKIGLARALLDIARRDAIVIPLARQAALILDTIRPTADLVGANEPMIETLLAAGRYDHAVGWTLLSGTSAGPGGNAQLPWLTLVDIGDAEEHVPHGSSVKYAEDLAAGGALSPIMLQRLATVMTALNYEVPIPIWQAAQNSGQSTSKADQGRLPEAGVLAKLQEAAKQKAVGSTALLAISAVGPGQATSTNTAALGEAIKALLAIGLEAEARRLAFEAVFDAWPRHPAGLAP